MSYLSFHDTLLCFVEYLNEWILCFFIHILKLAEVFSKDGMSFLASCQNLVSRPWVIDDLDNFQARWLKKPWKKVTSLTSLCFVLTMLYHDFRSFIAGHTDLFYFSLFHARL